MISFYPGPSKVDEHVAEYFKEAHESGILSINHRSKRFMELVQETQEIVKKKLDIPEDYSIFYVSSATECWEVLAQSFNGISYHFYNGSFGEKWFEATRKLKQSSIGYQFDLQRDLKLNEVDLSSGEGVICITQNETSNGTRITNKRIEKIYQSYPQHLLAVDATSSLGGADLKIDQADIWFASVQKCLGLPAGLALMICSPKAIKRAKNHNYRNHYNSLTALIDNMAKMQTTHTPNVANIFLLNRVLKNRKNIVKVSRELKKRARDLYALIDSKSTISSLVVRKPIRSYTVFTIKSSADTLSYLKDAAEKQGLILGKGYGTWNEISFRIANFPQITNKEWGKLLHFIDKNVS